MEQRAPDPFDLLVIGGGINGCGIARDAAGRGLSVMLVEQGDLAQGTSSASTKLIHGGLRYLEQFEFRLVREALQERERLLNSPRTSSGRCVSCFPTIVASARHGSFGSGSFSTIISRRAGDCRAAKRFACEAPLRRSLADRGFRPALPIRTALVDDSRLVVLYRDRCQGARRRHRAAHPFRLGPASCR